MVLRPQGAGLLERYERLLHLGPVAEHARWGKPDPAALQLR